MAEAKSSPASSDRPHVVVIDDDANFIQGLRLRLRPFRKQWRFSFYTQAKEFLEQMTLEEDLIIISDRNMPGMDGLKLCERVRAREEDPSSGMTYFIIISGDADGQRASEGLNAGADDYLGKPYHLEELLARIRAGARIIEGGRLLKEANRRLAELADRDPLTKVWNRRRGDEFLRTELYRARRGLQSVGVCLIDVDEFKGFNDEYGHLGGDAVLASVAETLLASCRDYDAVIRWGGDEFMVVLPAISPEDLDIVGERLRHSVENKAVESGGSLMKVTCSIGSVIASAGTGCEPKDLLRQADEALYEAKRLGRNRACQSAANWERVVLTEAPRGRSSLPAVKDG